jgi:16S rRNA (adenine1518-N6/adenine1519-N6)-dimethyltransferase
MRHTLAPRKRLGQHFLADDNIAKKIAASLELTKDDIVVEIGAGEGALTQHLAGHAKKLYAVELDSRAAAILQEKFGDEITLIHKDALTVSFEELATNEKQDIRVAGNIPYNITSPLLFHAFESHQYIKDVTFMMQKEVAERLTAKPRTKEYGILAVAAQFYSVPKILFNVSPKCFFPPPKVMSSVIHFDFRAVRSYDVDKKLFHTVLRATFGKRRKILLNGLKDIIKDSGTLSAISAQFDTSKRAEELTVNDFVTLTNVIASANGRTA